jgi:hypothetical protein
VVWERGEKREAHTEREGELCGFVYKIKDTRVELCRVLLAHFQGGLKKSGDMKAEDFTHARARRGEWAPGMGCASLKLADQWERRVYRLAPAAAKRLTACTE